MSAVPLSPPVATTARWLLRQHLRLAAWAVGILALALVGGVLLVDRISQPNISVVQFGRQAFLWFPFSVAIMTTAGFVPVHVAAGLTRRALGRATLLVAVTMGALYALAMTALLQVERLWYDAAGWDQEIVDTLVFTDSSQVGRILTDLVLVFTAAQLSGLLVGLAYYRGGGWWGTLTLPLTVGPVLVVSQMLTITLLDPLGLTARVGLAVALLAVTAVVYLVLLRSTPVRSSVA